MGSRRGTPPSPPSESGALYRRGARGYAVRVPSSPPPALFGRHRRATAVAVVVALGAAAVAIRLWAAWHARLSPEEASFWSTSVGIARAQEFPALGLAVSGSRAMLPGPLFFWIIAVSQIFVTSPLVANFYVSLLGLFGVLMLARTLDGVSGERDGRSSPASPRAVPTSDPGSAARWLAPLTSPGAVLFLFLIASPWWVIYTNSTWPGYVMTGMTACVVAALLRMIAKPRSRAALVVAFWMVAGFQVHLSLLHYWPLALAVLVFFRPRLNARWIAAGVLLGAACYIPYLVHEIRFGFANTRLLLAKSQGGARDVRTLAGLYLYYFGFPTTDISFLWQHGFWYPFDHFRFWGGDGERLTTGFLRTAGPVAFLWTMHVVTWLVSVAALATGAARLMTGWRRGARRPDPLTLFYLVSLIDITGFYLLSGKGGYAHYVSVLLPISYFPVASFLAWIARVHPRLGPAVVTVYLGAFAASGLLVMRGYYQIDSRWSAIQTDRVVRYVLERTQGPDGRPQPFRMDFGFAPAWAYPYQVVARRLHHAPWLSQPNASHSFFVGPRDPDQPAAAASQDRLDLETIFVSGR